MKRRAILVLEVGGAVAGYATFAPAAGRAQPGAAEVQELYLAPEYQGIGLGVRLFAAALKRIKSRGYGRVLVRALAENDRANAFLPPPRRQARRAQRGNARRPRPPLPLVRVPRLAGDSRSARRAPDRIGPLLATAPRRQNT